MLRVPWDRSARYAMPVDVWRADDRRALPVSQLDDARRDTLERLMRRKAERGLPTLDACVADLLEGGED